MIFHVARMKPGRTCIIIIKQVPNLVANLQGGWARDFRLWISIKRKETWRQQFESAPGYTYINTIQIISTSVDLRLVFVLEFYQIFRNF